MLFFLTIGYLAIGCVLAGFALCLWEPRRDRRRLLFTRPRLYAQEWATAGLVVLLWLPVLCLEAAQTAADAWEARRRRRP